MKKFLLACVAAFFSVVAIAAPPGARPMTLADMAKPPVTAVAVTQCNLLVAAYFTLQSGELVKTDVKHQMRDYNKVLAWGDTALQGAERVEVPCDQQGYQSTANEAPAALSDADIGVVVRLHVCGEVIALIAGSPTGLEILILKDLPPDHVKTVLENIETAKKAGAPVRDVELSNGCART